MFHYAIGQYRCNGGVLDLSKSVSAQTELRACGDLPMALVLLAILAPHTGGVDSKERPVAEMGCRPVGDAPGLAVEALQHLTTVCLSYWPARLFRSHSATFAPTKKEVQRQVVPLHRPLGLALGTVVDFIVVDQR